MLSRSQMIGKLAILLLALLAVCSVEADDGGLKVDLGEVFERLVNKEDLRLNIYHVRFFSAITPVPDEENIKERADIVTDVGNEVVSRAILGQLERSLKPCELEEGYEFYDIRLRIDVLSGSSSNGDMLVSDGYVMKLNGVETLGCMGDMLRFLYGMGDVGYFGYDEYDEMLRKELGCCNSSASEQEEIRDDHETD